MINQSTVNLALVLSLGVWTIMSGLLAMQTIWVFAQGNLSQIINQTGKQTGNQTGNQSLSPAIAGQQGGTPPTP
jgi:ABC-type molybdate transport system substrate-binding protein